MAMQTQQLQLTTLEAGTPLTEILAVIERDGGVIVRDFLEPELMKRLNSELDSHLDTSPPGSRSGHPLWQTFHGRNTKRICGLTARCPSFVEVLTHRTLLGYADALLLPNCGSYWLNTSQMMVIGPGETAQMLHRDDGNWPHFSWPRFELTVSSIFALSDFTEENGATWVVPGSNRWEDESRRPELSEIAKATMSAGSVLLYSGKVIHGAGENSAASEWRRGMHVSYVLGWLRPEEHHFLQVPLDVARTLPERARQLLGYATYLPSGIGGRLGLVDFNEAVVEPAS